MIFSSNIFHLCDLSVLLVHSILGVAFPVGVLGSSFKRIYDLHFDKLRSRIVAKKKRVAREVGSSSKGGSLKLPRRDSAVKSGKHGGSMIPKRGIHPTPLGQGYGSGKGHGIESIPVEKEKMEPIRVGHHSFHNFIHSLLYSHMTTITIL